MNEPFHSFLETLGFFASLSLALIILWLHDQKKGKNHYYLIAAALIGMGILDGFHAIVAPGNTFVWLHCLAVLTGGLFFSMVWTTFDNKNFSMIRHLPFLIAISSVVIGIISLFFPKMLPLMISDGIYTITASAINVLSGLLFTIAMILFLVRYNTNEAVEEVLFALICFFNASASFLFAFGDVWSAEWWLWHLLRLTACIIMLGYMFVTFKNIHKLTQKMAEELRIAFTYTRSLIEASVDPLVTKGPDGKITDVNKATETITGCTRQELIGTDFSDYFTEPEKARAGYQRVFSDGSVRDYELFLRHKDGHVTPVQYNASVYRDDSGRVVGVFAAARDMTALKIAEEELKKHRDHLEILVNERTIDLAAAVANLERSNKELEQFAYVASHDLQEPLRMVSSYTQLLAQKYEGMLDEKAKKYIDYAVDGAVRMQRLINDLLVYSRIGTQGRPPEMTDSHSVLGMALLNLSTAIEESRAIVANDDLPVVKVDASQLLHLFQNIIANAIKFRGANLPRIHVCAKDSGNEWLFSVNDNGIGIDMKYSNRLFMIFQRLHTHQEYPGTGIGLAVCKRIVERHGGKIWVESAPEKGSTFYFTLPKGREKF